MKVLTERLRAIQNLGWMDRVVRILIGVLMLGYPLVLIMGNEDVQPNWVWYSMLLSTYPWLTGIFGFDPIYGLFSIRTCKSAGNNVCGTFPYQVKAAVGGKPRPNSSVDHRLEDSPQR